jgi:hypothetical protein
MKEDLPPSAQYGAGKLQQRLQTSPASTASTVEYHTPRTAAASPAVTAAYSSPATSAAQAAGSGIRRRLWDLGKQEDATVYGPIMDIGAVARPLHQLQQDVTGDLGDRLHGSAPIPQPYIPQLTTKEAKRLAENRHTVLHRKVNRVLQPRQPPW